MSTLQYIRDTYKVPAKLGGRVRFYGKPGTITGADGYGHLIVQPLRAEDRVYKSTRWRCHPTWRMEYLDAAGQVMWPLPA